MWSGCRIRAYSWVVVEGEREEEGIGHQLLEGKWWVNRVRAGGIYIAGRDDIGRCWCQHPADSEMDDEAPLLM